MKIITTNRKAFHDYVIDSTIETGIVLAGDEVKSLRAGLVNLSGSFATIHGGELYITNCYIGPYSHAYMKAAEEYTRRSRKLLVHRAELVKLAGELSRRGITLVPLKVYLNEKGRIKVELGRARHKKMAERKEELRERDIEREMRREGKQQHG